MRCPHRRVQGRNLLQLDAAVSPFEASLMKYADAFLSGDRDAFAAIYDKARGPLVNRAVKDGASEDDAEDIVHEAFMYVQSRGTKTWNGQSIMALLNRAVDWYGHKAKRTNDRLVLHCDLPVDEFADDIGEEFEHPIDLEAMEEKRLQEGAALHPYLTSINLRTPEDIELAENLRQQLERFGREGCGDEAWDIYAAVTLEGISQAAVGEKHGVSQQRVSQICNDVAVAMRKGLVGK